MDELLERNDLDDPVQYSDDHLITGLEDGKAASRRFKDIFVATLMASNPDGTATVQVDVLGNVGSVCARSLVFLSEGDVGRELALMFEGGDPAKPIILGCMAAGGRGAAAADEVEIAGDQQVVLRCGKASITLTREGKILLRGAYISSRSSGVIRIKGGSVQIN